MTFDEFLARLDNVKRSGNDKATARCPSHKGGNENTNSLSIARKDDGGVLVKCWTVCTVEQVCGALGIEIKELFPPKDEPKGKHKKREEPSPKPLTLEEFAEAKRLPIDWLRSEGLENFPDGSGVAIAYFLEDGAQHPRMRRRTALRAKDGSSWNGPTGVPLIPYGLWKIKEWLGQSLSGTLEKLTRISEPTEDDGEAD